MKHISVMVDLDKDLLMDALGDLAHEELADFTCDLDEWVAGDWDFTRELYKKLSKVMKKCPPGVNFLADYLAASLEAMKAVNEAKKVLDAESVNE
jgi:hypothetical protein